MENNIKNHIIKTLKSTKRDTTKLIKYLEENGYFEAPSSSKYNCAYEGGLAEHSLNVMDAMFSLDIMLHDTYGMPKEDYDSIVLVSLLHDLCKVDFYKQKTLWRKDENGKWESYIGYERDVTVPMGQGAKSMYMSNRLVELTEKESQAIYYHRGAYDPSDYKEEMGKAFKENGLAFKLMLSELIATYILENEIISWEDVNEQLDTTN